ncbi:MAG: electron transfer flavoprotein subunit beta/FixA family protein [Actinobacteria bacterium]|nr:electron transfer flavoprotein subunit beta/FixA family protein [Actinomycetota bacterium]
MSEIFRIIVCIKQVPGTTEIKINPETNTLVREGVETIINPFDSYAIEEGVRIKERFVSTGSSADDIEVVALTMGPPQAESMLREAISLGADRAVLLSDRVFAGADTWATALTLKHAIKKFEKYNIIIFGKQTLDGDTGQVGPELAHMLHIPFIGYASSIEEIDNRKMTVKRLAEDRYETFEIRLPAAISVGKDINVPRVPSLRGKLRAKNEKIPVWSASELDMDENHAGLSGSYTQVIKIFTPKHLYEVKMMEGGPDEQVEELFGKLKEINVL